MSNVTRLAPYAYLAKRSGSNTLYDLLLLVPVDANGDTDLSNVTPVKPGGTRVRITYTTNSNAANATYRSRHWVIDSDGSYLDIEIKGDNDADKTTVIAFADADTEQASVSDEKQTCAPHLFAKMETVGTDKFVQMSCIVLFDSGLGAQSESVIFAPNSCKPSFTLGNSSATTDPGLFVINQSIKAALTPNTPYTFEGTVEENTSHSKPPRKHVIKIVWNT